MPNDDFKAQVKASVPENIYSRYFDNAEFLNDKIVVLNKGIKDTILRKKNIVNALKDAYGFMPEIEIGETVEEVKEEANPNKQKTPPPDPEPAVDKIRIPYWPDDKRAAPASVFRSAIFTARQSRFIDKVKRLRESFTDIEIPNLNGLKMLYRGEFLNQEDMHVWLEALHMSRDVGPDMICETTYREMLKNLDRPTGGDQYTWLDDTLIRLRHALIRIEKTCPEGKPISETKNKLKSGDWITFNLLKELEGNSVTNTVRIAFNKELISYFFGKFWPRINMNWVIELKRKGLALWLLNFYATHQEPFDIKATTIFPLTGLSGGYPQFLQGLRKALSDLKDVTGWNTAKLIGKGKNAKVRVIKQNKVTIIPSDDDSQKKDIPSELPPEWKKAANFASRFDLYRIFDEWKEWNDGKPLKDPKGAFIGFCRKKISD